jgi:hypothetical protein
LFRRLSAAATARSALAELLEQLAGECGCEIHPYAMRSASKTFSKATSDRQDRRSPRESGAIFWHQVPSVPGPHVAQFLAWMF